MTKTTSLIAAFAMFCAIAAAAPQGGDDSAQAAGVQIRLRFAEFDPLIEAPPIDPALQSLPGARLHLVQFRTMSRESYRAALRELGAEVHGFMPEQAYLVRMDPATAPEVAGLPFVRWIGAYHPAYRLHEDLHAELRSGGIAPGRFNLLVVSKRDRTELFRKIELLGGRIAHPNDGSHLIEADLDTAQLLAVAQLDEVLWIDRWSPIEEDIDNARIQGGANYLEPQGAGFTGIGIKGHVLEGIYRTHPDFAARSGIRQAPIAVDDPASSSHGQSTYGEIYGSGAGRAAARGLCPDAQGYYTNYNAIYSAPAGSTGPGSRYELTDRLVNTHNVWFQTASWGYARVTSYDSRSAEMDDIIFDFGLCVSNSQSNSGGTPSRPQAWAKNVFSGGAVNHYDTANPNDDRWAGGASIGPANDGRIKPTLCAYYDDILTTSGSSSYTTSFGGTSGATPIINGYMGLTIQMWTDGIFGNVLPNPTGTRFDNRPKFTTVKALMCNTARQYTFSGASHDLTRVHQGWGFPSVEDMWNLKDKMLVVNEEDVIANQQSASYTVTVGSGEPLFRATLNWNEPPGNPAAAYQRVNNLDLKVTAPDNTIYWGNNGLLAGMYSTPGGTPNTVDTLEMVIVQNPLAGVWTVEVIGADINTDNHVETPAVDADFALVVSGGVPAPPCSGSFSISGMGCRDVGNPFYGYIVRIFMTGNPCLGSQARIGITGSPVHTFPVVITAGTSDTTWNGAALPLDLTPYGGPGCTIYSSQELAFPLANPGGGSAVDFQIPGDPNLNGLTIHWQGFFVSPWANSLGLAASDKLTTVIGS